MKRVPSISACFVFCTAAVAGKPVNDRPVAVAATTVEWFGVGLIVLAAYLAARQAEA
jgi:hypothetical protein